MVIHSPIFSGSIIQDKNNAYANLSGSFTGSVTGSFKGEIDVQQATFENLIVTRTLRLGAYADDIQKITGSLLLSGSENIYGDIRVTGSVNLTTGAFRVDGVNVLDTALAYAIALG
jgi:hypothetical protein